ncbi:MAG: hypothetical protein LBL04_01150 [Bacteroidales bacterium]|nr:hypothetical protein [Bacteroidales bacterium]
MFRIYLIVVILVAIAVAGLAIGILIKGKFPDTHVGSNADMKKMGVTCAKNDSALCQGRSKADGCRGCSCAE